MEDLEKSEYKQRFEVKKKNIIQGLFKEFVLVDWSQRGDIYF